MGAMQQRAIGFPAAWNSFSTRSISGVTVMSAPWKKVFKALERLRKRRGLFYLESKVAEILRGSESAGNDQRVDVLGLQLREGLGSSSGDTGRF